MAMDKPEASGAQKTTVAVAALLTSYGICRLRKDVLNVLSAAIPEHELVINMVNFLGIILGVEISSEATRTTYNVFKNPNGLKYLSQQLDEMSLIFKGPLVHTVMALMVFGLMNVMSDLFYLYDGKQNSSQYNLKFLALFTTVGIMISFAHYYYGNDRKATQKTYQPQVS